MGSSLSLLLKRHALSVSFNIINGNKTLLFPPGIRWVKDTVPGNLEIISCEGYVGTQKCIFLVILNVFKCIEHLLVCAIYFIPGLFSLRKRQVRGV